MNDHNFEQCIKCTICTAYCPVVAVNPLYPGPKQAGPDGERFRIKNKFFFDENLKYCMNCKRCEVACPSGVNIADIIHSARMHYGHQTPNLRDRILASTDIMGSLARPFAPVVNAVAGSAPGKWAMDTFLGVDQHRTFPKYQFKGFVGWFKREKEAEQASYPRQIAFFHGCSTEYQHPEVGKAFVRVMNALGIGVQLLDEECCGVAMISNAMWKQAKQHARHNVAAFEKAVEAGLPVVTTASTCTFTMRDEYPHILGVDNAKVRSSIVLVEKFIHDLVDQGKVKLVFRKDYKARMAYHIPCHMEKLGWSIFTKNLLQMIPGADLTVLGSGCCGIAGTYGFKKENYGYSQAIGQPVFDEIARVNPEFVVSECDTCKWQIEMSTGYAVKNPILILSEALDLEATAKANGING